MEEKALEKSKENNLKKFWIKELMEYVIWLAGVWITVQIIINFIGVVCVVDGSSMEPTLYNGEFLWVSKWGYHFSEPERFDVIVFPIKYQGKDSHFVKRIIGLPGETVYIDEDGAIYINDEMIIDAYGKEIIAEHNRYLAAQPITLGEGEYFLLGDNRNHSSDSRVELVGNIERERIIGKVVARLWPLEQIGLIE